jgi:arylsulfatase A-like enzyme
MQVQFPCIKIGATHRIRPLVPVLSMYGQVLLARDMLTPQLQRLAETGVILDSYYTAPRYTDPSATETGGNWGHTRQLQVCQPLS